VLEPFAEQFPGRFINVGVAEQNMVGVATGLADAGFLPFIYSIAPFAVLRPFEFIRNGPVLHRLPVRIVGVGGGFDYGLAGPSHHALEDVGALRMLPGLTLIAPADSAQACAALEQTWHLPGPVYYRLGTDDRVPVPGLRGRFELGRLQIVSRGSDIVLLAMGAIAHEVAAAGRLLSARGVGCTVAVVASLSPAPVADLERCLSRCRTALAVEEHYVNGGLGSLVAEVIAENGLDCRLVRCGVRKPADGLSGGPKYLCQAHALSRTALVRTALQALEAVDPRPESQRRLALSKKEQ
jgi:transketolase